MVSRIGPQIVLLEAGKTCVAYIPTVGRVSGFIDVESVGRRFSLFCH